MPETVFMLSHSTYDGGEEIYLKSTVPMSEVVFQNLCSSLMTAAADRAVQQDVQDEFHSWVGYPEILRSLKDILITDHGFREFKPKDFHLSHGCIIDLDDREECRELSDAAFAQVCAHNVRVREQLHKRRDS